VDSCGEETVGVACAASDSDYALSAMRSLPLLGLVAGWLAGCGLLGPDETRTRFVGFVSLGQGSVSMPDSARAGVPFTVSITTDGGGCDESGYIDVAYYQDGSVGLTPYDFLVQHDGRSCTLLLSALTKTVQVTIGTAGTTRIDIKTRRRGGGLPHEGVDLTITRNVQVR
jgi:hypothetical protein